jgi:hypothetical protein
MACLMHSLLFLRSQFIKHHLIFHQVTGCCLYVYTYHFLPQMSIKCKENFKCRLSKSEHTATVHCISLASLQVFTVVTMKSVIFWDVILCGLVKFYHCLLPVHCFLGLLINSENGGCTSIVNDDKLLLEYMVSCPRRLYSCISLLPINFSFEFSKITLRFL